MEKDDTIARAHPSMPPFAGGAEALQDYQR
jgi:hypothetical protein